MLAAGRPGAHALDSAFRLELADGESDEEWEDILDD
jgi:hypothetical protein